MADKRALLIFIPVTLILALMPFLAPSQAQAQTATPTPHATPTPATPPKLHYDSDATRSNINSMLQALTPAVIVLAGTALGLVLLYWAISAIRRYTS
jgi:hypothetical protein